MEMNARLAAALAKPMTHAVVSVFADGTDRRHETRCAKSAENYAVGERRKIGKDLVSRDPITLVAGPVVRIVEVRIEPIN